MHVAKHFAGICAALAASGALAQTGAIAPPPLAPAVAKCRAGQDPVPAGSSWQSGLSTDYGALTPARMNGVTTVSPRESACLIEELGSHLMVVGAMDDEIAITDAYRMPWGGLGGSFSDANQTEFISKLDRFSKNDRGRPLLVYCHSRNCFASYNALLRAQHAGYSRLFWLREGLKGWREAGYAVGPVRRKDSGVPWPVKIPTPAFVGNEVENYPTPPGFGTDAWYANAPADRHRLCLSAAGLLIFDEKDPYQRNYPKIYLDKMSGIDPARDNEVAARRKLQAFWKQNAGKLDCGYYSLLNGHFLRIAANGFTPQALRFYRDVVDNWKVDLNHVELRDGRTLLDYVADNWAERTGNSQSELTWIYSFLRKGGAKHRRELEAEGKWPDARTLQARFIEQHRAAAARGEIHSMGHLAFVLHRGLHIAPNPAEARQWVDRVEQSVLAGRDANAATTYGYEFYAGRAPYPKDGARAYRLFKRAADLGDANGRFWVGRLLYEGVGVPRDRAKAAEVLLAGGKGEEGAGALMVANYYWSVGRRADAELYYRTALSTHPLDPTVDGVPLKEWMLSKGLNPCGRVLWTHERWCRQ